MRLYYAFGVKRLRNTATYIGHAAEISTCNKRHTKGVDVAVGISVQRMLLARSTAVCVCVFFCVHLSVSACVCVCACACACVHVSRNLQIEELKV